MRYAVLTFFLIGCFSSLGLKGQVGMLSKGNWVKIAVPNEGVYQVTGGQLKAMGFTGKISASQVQLFGMDLTNLTEKVPVGLPDSLKELAIEMQDGGDDFLDDQDRFLFYAQGKNSWVINDREVYPIRQKNATNDSLYFFMRLGTKGKRITSFTTNKTASKLVQDYTSKWLIEKDTINILSSGKVWLGDPMGSGVGKKTSLIFPLNMEGLQLSRPIFIQTHLAASTYQSDAFFDIKLNELPLLSSSIATVSGYLFDEAYKIKSDTATLLLDANKLFKIGQSTANINLQVNFNAGPTATGWIDFIALHAQRKIGFWGTNGFGFDYRASNVTSQIVEFEIQNATVQTKVWEVSNCLQPIAMTNLLGQNSMSTFKTNDSAYKQFYVFETNKVSTAQISGLLVNDSNFKIEPVEYIIITAPDYYPAALKLKTFHEKQNGYKVSLVLSTQIFNEMASGQTTPIALRNYVKYMVDLAAKNNQLRPSYLLLFGIGNFNASSIQVNKELPVFTSEVSNAILTSYSTDDFYAILKEGDQIQNAQSIDSIQLAVGRIPARNAAESEVLVKKLIQYQSSKKMGIWQNQIAWVADDADYNLHLQDAEEIVQNLNTKTTNWNHRKIYLDLFKVTKTLAGASYPDVNKAIQASIQSGSLLLNYTGHGNYLRLSEEAVITKTEMDQWNHSGKWPIMVTASCDFAPYDQPALTPIGFDALMKNEKGIIALVAANRLVFAYSNKQINDAFMQALLVPNKQGYFATIGQALQAAKKFNFSKNGDRLNAFKFGLMGDPAMQIAQPKHEIQLMQLDQLPWSDTLFLKTGGKYTIKGAVVKQQQIIQDFNGFVDMVLWDAPITKQTLANQSTSQSVAVETQEQAIFKGKATVQNGQFEISFIVPMSMPVSNLAALKLQLYAYNDTIDASKQFQSIFIQGAAAANRLDTVGPSIKAFINTASFKSGDWVTMPANLMVELKDSAGIQSAGNELGHDLKLIIDDSITTTYNLNNFFSYALNQYQSGLIQYSLPNLSEGKHRLIIKAWDLLGNLSKDTLYIEVPSLKQNNLRNLTVVPNPVQASSRFVFEIKNVLDPLELTIEVFDLSGQLHFSSVQQIQPIANKIGIDWDGRSNQGGRIPAGVYYYRISVIQRGIREQLLNTLLKF